VRERQLVKRLRQLVEAGALAALGALVMPLTYRRALAVGRAVGRSAWACGLRRGVVEGNLRLAFPEWEARQVETTGRRCYEIWGQALVDYLRIPKLRDPAAWAEVMGPVRGIEYLEEVLRGGRGAILLSGHFGVFEFIGAATAAAGHRVDFVVQPQSNAWVDHWLTERRQSLGVGVIRRGSELREVLRRLRGNACVAMAADQDARGLGVFVEFLGRPSSTPTGPAVLSLRTGAPIVMGFAVRGADGRHRFTAVPALEFAPSGDFDADVAALTQLHTSVLEQWVRRHPEHWYWLHRRWKTEPPAGAGGPRRPGAWPRAAVACALALGLGLVGGATAKGPAPKAGRASPAVPAGELSEPPRFEPADATTFGGAGTSLLPLAPTRVARLAEDLVVRRVPGGWAVDVIDVFIGGGAPEVVPAGLPDFEAAADTEAVRSTLSEVRLLADGVELPASIEPPPLEKDLPGLGGVGRFFVWQLRFAADERKVVRLSFRVGTSGTEGGEELLFYYLNTGTPWRGPSGRVNARVELGPRGSDDLVAGWLRPTRFGVTDSSVTWLLDGEEPEEDLVVASAAGRDPLGGFTDRERGPLALGTVEREEWLARTTPREWRFWQAWLRARLGEAPADSALRARLSAEPWFAGRPAGRLRRPTKPEAALLQALTRRQAEWAGHAIPPDERAGGR
jgi:KDO2-lipid IV(A) lauroyltransferase